ncbi:MAG: UDP-N-acetylglucosamine diphosphorylase/glucosamine-1-phosphate N-acetyltransferase [Candidatus Thioglobus sp.]|nr:UDP-N-acetylglucosamine diphosphorylase/glucosamine-1-phosphate N-acetyltransferase [Candidatus Thioglobus sp.]
MKTINAIILAAGKGSRMHSETPKVLHDLAGKPLLEYVLAAATALAEQTYVVYGFGGEKVQKTINQPEVKWVEQAQQLGTGHAVLQALEQIATDSISLILYGDVPLISRQTLQNLLDKLNKNDVALLSVNLENPTGYGRIIRQNGQIQAIIEQPDANPQQLKISEVNTGFMALESGLLKTYLQALNVDNAQGEMYLTDIIKMAAQDGKTIGSVLTENQFEVAGVNDKTQLAALERAFQLEQARQFMQAGLTLKDPSRLDCRGSLTFGKDCEIDVNVVFIGTVILGDNVKILPNCIIENCKIQSGASIGPFARIRPETDIGANAKIGNFVEVKKSKIGANTKISHLSYIGDSTVGAGVNIGAGVITCNFDGAKKHQTNIQDGAFIGSNSQLIAPVTIGKNATIGAGSTISKNAPDNALSLSRGKQISIKNWKKPSKN